MSKKNYIDRMLEKNILKYSMYKYASESFKMAIGKTEIRLSRDTASHFGYTWISKGQKELIKELKKYFRTKTIFRTRYDEVFGLRLTDGQILYLSYATCKRYDIKDKLYQYKALKNDCLKRDIIKFQKGTFIPNGENKAIDYEEEIKRAYKGIFIGRVG